MTLTTISSRGLIGLLTTQAVVPTTTTFFASKLSSLAQVVGGRQGKLLSTTKALLLTQLPHYNTRRNIRSSSFPSRPLSDQQRRAKNSAFFSSSIRSAPTMVQDWDMNLDPVQKKLLEEECIVLDKDDKVIGHDSKKNCHLIRNGDVLLHRAFSVFLFNTKGELLLQQRSKTKITFPNLWTNSCCSHPLYVSDEIIEKEALGIKIAAKRRMEFELGISPDAIDISDFHYLTRIHYKALSNDMWGEHEIDYILFLQKDIQLKPNKEEVSEIRYVNLDNIKKMSEIEGVSLTPWFELIYKTWLPLWWNNLSNLAKFDDHKVIHRM
ncbi:isopentenyl-diphosphate Delta-isomerase 1 isoform X2 [Folsomia candida]|uniref:isopentenyl-diphosphate Delta-isomerase 1 isoform X2 n=1 Tax=Folsomia candida TaxID=158441 RepID=UPI000B8FCAB0|nr:isopentenyl-diphosphate Delta-isomerase 1 isoform X2 [Folsomia candida]